MVAVAGTYTIPSTEPPEPSLPPPPPRASAQGALFPFETLYGPGALIMAVTFDRLPRRRCQGCNSRRICFQIRVGELLASSALCAKCWGIRR